MNRKKQITHWLSVIVIGIVLGLAIQFVKAWTEPSQAPPGGNLGAPINTGAQTQTKSGGLNVNGGMLIGASTTGGNMGAGTINADQVCIRGVCQTTWPSGTTPAPAPSCASCDGWGCGQIMGQCPSYVCQNGSWVYLPTDQCG